MPCDAVPTGMTQAQRKTQVEKALERLNGYLAAGQVQVNIGPTGAVAFTNWQDRDAVTDVCAYRALAASNSWALRQAVARAEMLGGRKVKAAAIAAGTHSHDNGKTWSEH